MRRVVPYRDVNVSRNVTGTQNGASSSAAHQNGSTAPFPGSPAATGSRAGFGVPPPQSQSNQNQATQFAWNPPGSFTPQSPSIPDIRDVSMSSAGQDDDEDEDAPITQSEPSKPTKPKRSLEKFGGKLLNAFRTSPKKGRGKEKMPQAGHEDSYEWDEDDRPRDRSPRKRRPRTYSNSSDGGDELGVSSLVRIWRLSPHSTFPLHM